MSELTLDEAIKHCLEVASENDSQAAGYNEHDEWEFVNKCNCEQCAADHRQLAEWLTELKDLRNSVGAVKLAQMKDALNLISDLRQHLFNSEKDLMEAKRLLKLAVEDMNDNNICYDINPCNVCTENKKCPCDTFKWRYTDEALKLLGGSENGET